MNAEQKKFILDELIPFILREQGRGFIMDYWLTKGHDSIEGLNLGYPPPACDTVACIGGSIQVLRPDTQYVDEVIGLNANQADALFYGWLGKSSDNGNYWPQNFCVRYHEAGTPLERAQVACDLLRLVAETEGACLITFGGAR